MLGLSLGLSGRAPAVGGASPPPAVIRVAAVSLTEAFLIAAHATVGAVALHLIEGNGPVDGFTAADAGVEAGGWRIQGLRVLPSVASNPATQAAETIYQGFGSQQIAINVGGIFAGHLHGLGTTIDYAQSAPNLTANAMIAPTPIASSGRLAWPNGAGATWSDSFMLNADGSIATTATVTSTADAFQAYLDMTILGPAFSRASYDGGATWVDLSTYALNAFVAVNVSSIIMRNPSTGITVTVTDDLPIGVNGRSKSVMRRSGDFKIYPEASPSGTAAFGTLKVDRTIVVGKTSPDPTVTLTADVTQAEGNSGATAFVFTVTRSAAIGAVNIAWTFSAGNTSADDYIGGAYPTGGTVALANGVASATFTVNVSGDTMAESNEAFGVAIAAPVGYAPGLKMTAAGGLTNDDVGVTYAYDGVVNGDTLRSPNNNLNWNPTRRTWDNTNKRYAFSRGTFAADGGAHRTIVPLVGLTPGTSYSVSFAGSLAGAGVASAGVSLGMTTDPVSGGSQTSTIPAINASIAAGTTPYTFAATASSMWIVITQGYTASSDQIFYLAALATRCPSDLSRITFVRE